MRKPAHNAADYAMLKSARVAPVAPLISYTSIKIRAVTYLFITKKDVSNPDRAFAAAVSQAPPKAKKFA